MINVCFNFFTDKAKPVERRGRKTTGLLKTGTAGLPG